MDRQEEQRAGIAAMKALEILLAAYEEILSIRFVSITDSISVKAVLARSQNEAYRIWQGRDK